ncbi:MAG: hypothetical protein SGPRY_002446, partial [Prymnesium sp.]
MGLAAPRPLSRKLVSLSTLRHDLPELPELDSLFSPEGAIAQAQTLAAQAFGAAKSWFLVNGSTSGVLAAVLAAVQLWSQQQAGERGSMQTPVVLLPRNAHKSAVHALVLSGATPGWLAPEYDDASGISLGIAPCEIERSLKRECGVPLLVDEAHGGHLHFLPPSSPLAPGEGLANPRSALSQGADVAVVGSLTQSAMLHASDHALASQPRMEESLSRAIEQERPGIRVWVGRELPVGHGKILYAS